jgi:hypothetical protein
MGWWPCSGRGRAGQATVFFHIIGKSEDGVNYLTLYPALAAKSGLFQRFSLLAHSHIGNWTCELVRKRPNYMIDY